MRGFIRQLRRRLGPERLLPILLFVMVAGGVGLAFANLFANLHARNIASGFGYLSQAAGFEIGESWIRYTPQMSAARALLVGLINTLVAGGAVAVFITLIGLLAGLVLSFGGEVGQAVLARYVGLTRNMPVLLHLVVWYSIFREGLPPPRSALTLGPIVLSNRGLILPVPEGSGGWVELAIAVASAAGLAAVARAAKGRWSAAWTVFALLAGFLIWLCLLPMSVPMLRGFNYAGGWAISPEFCALVLALGLYGGGYVTEIVRGAVNSFPRGQVESAFALGLSRVQFFLLVMTPQLARSIAPAMVNQYVNVIKWTSLGIVIGYPDLISVSNMSLTQTGQAVEAIALILAIYLAISLFVSFVSQRVFGNTTETTLR